MTDRVAIVNVSGGDYGPSLERALELIHFDRRDLAGRSVVIKPNLSDLQRPESGLTTDVFLVEALVRLLKRDGCREIAVVESDHWISTADEEFRRLGYNSMAEKNKIRLINLSKSPSYRVALQGKRFKEIRIPKELMEYDFFISVPKLKTHGACYITCALKNQFGMNAKRHKSEHHAYLSEAIYDLNKLYSPNLVVVDGNFVRTGDNSAQQIGLLLVGKDPVVIDCVVSELFAVIPKQVPYLQYHLRARQNLPDIEVVGMPLKDCLIRTSFRRPQRPGALRNLSNIVYAGSEQVGKIETTGKKLAALMSKVDDYLAGTPRHLLVPAIARGYREFMARNREGD